MLRSVNDIVAYPSPVSGAVTRNDDDNAKASTDALFLRQRVTTLEALVDLLSVHCAKLLCDKGEQLSSLLKEVDFHRICNDRTLQRLAPTMTLHSLNNDTSQQRGRATTPVTASQSSVIDDVLTRRASHPITSPHDGADDVVGAAATASAVGDVTFLRTRSVVRDLCDLAGSNAARILVLEAEIVALKGQVNSERRNHNLAMVRQCDELESRSAAATQRATSAESKLAKLQGLCRRLNLRRWKLNVLEIREGLFKMRETVTLWRHEFATSHVVDLCRQCCEQLLAANSDVLARYQQSVQALNTLRGDLSRLWRGCGALHPRDDPTGPLDRHLRLNQLALMPTVEEAVNATIAASEIVDDGVECPTWTRRIAELSGVTGSQAIVTLAVASDGQKTITKLSELRGNLGRGCDVGPIREAVAQLTSWYLQGQGDLHFLERRWRTWFDAASNAVAPVVRAAPTPSDGPAYVDAASGSDLAISVADAAVQTDAPVARGSRSGGRASLQSPLLSASIAASSRRASDSVPSHLRSASSVEPLDSAASLQSNLNSASPAITDSDAGGDVELECAPSTASTDGAVEEDTTTVPSSRSDGDALAALAALDGVADGWHRFRLLRSLHRRWLQRFSSRNVSRMRRFIETRVLQRPSSAARHMRAEPLTSALAHQVARPAMEDGRLPHDGRLTPTSIRVPGVPLTVSSGTVEAKVPQPPPMSARLMSAATNRRGMESHAYGVPRPYRDRVRSSESARVGAAALLVPSATGPGYATLDLARLMRTSLPPAISPPPSFVVTTVPQRRNI